MWMITVSALVRWGRALFGLRLIDVVQDPMLGWLAEASRRHRGKMVAGAAALMSVAMLGLFAVVPPFSPLLWFALTLAMLFSAFSFLTIAFYAEGVARARALGTNGHLRLAGWRETGALIGISVAAVAPVALASVTDRPFAAFAVGFAGLAVLGVWAMQRDWSGAAGPSVDLRETLRDAMTRRLLLIAMINAAPVAVTSTLFLFFVESRLQAPGTEGPLLLLFFLAAAVTAPVWAALARRHGARKVLLAGMALAVLAFAFATGLEAGDTVAFAVICAASGAALGADLTLLPAIFSRHLASLPRQSGEAAAFGLWSFASKAALAFAAVLVLPYLERRGFVPGGTNTPEALAALTLTYAVLPCALKLLAIGLLALTPLPEA
jgi:glycoside/pentoside/hexuronide:cation symporter, GPH family